jgi:PAS domain S-box-containing protein
MGKYLRTLIVEDSEDDTLLVLRVLNRGGFDVTFKRVDTAPSMEAAVKGEEWDIVIADYVMPSFSGPGALAMVKKYRPDLPFIIISGVVGEEYAVAAMHAGAHDYVRKDNLSRLIPAIERELKEAEVRRERNRVLDALWESEAKYRSLFEKMLNGFAYHKVILDEEGRPVDYVFLEVNDAYEKLTGLRKHEIVGKRATEVIPGVMESGQRLIDLYGRVALTGEEARLEQEPEATGRWYYINAYSPGKGYFVTVLEDITERKRAEAELKGLFTTLNILVEHIPDGVVLLDAGNRIVMANPAGGEQLKTLTGASAGDVLTHLDGRPVDEVLGTPPRIVWHELRADNRSFKVAGRTVGATGGAVIVIRDVTEEMEREKRLYMQDRLAAVGQLASGIAHDFNNILTVINGYAEILLTDVPLPEEARQDVDAIMQSGRKATELIGQILDFSRKSPSEMKAVSVLPFIKEFSKFLGRTIPEDIRVTLDFGPGEYAVMADLAKLQQVLANLAVNARDSMPGGGEMKVGLSTMDLGPEDEPPLSDMPPGEWVSISVSDTGSGIRPEIMPHIFDPFFTTKDRGKGAGLGLAQVYGIVKQHGGFITADTEAGRGSSFIIYLPSVKHLEEEVREERKALAPKGRGETVLVVEDEEAVRELVRKVLSGLGYKLMTARNGSEALETFESHREEIGLLLTDLVMPDMGGLELSGIARDKDPSLKVIAMSGYLPGLDENELRKAGIVDFIKKPFKARRLAEAVSKALKT